MEFSTNDREQLDNDVRCTGITFKIRGVAIVLMPIRLIGIDMLHIVFHLHWSVLRNCLKPVYSYFPPPLSFSLSLSCLLSRIHRRNVRLGEATDFTITGNLIQDSPDVDIYHFPVSSRGGSESTLSSHTGYFAIRGIEISHEYILTERLFLTRLVATGGATNTAYF